jgi:DNA-binding NarL/FixJ family response regulator
LSLAEKNPPQMALVDIVLGDENGIECARRLHAQSAATRIILLSAYPDRAYHQLGLDAGAIAFLDKKDLSAAALREIIHDVFPVAHG